MISVESRLCSKLPCGLADIWNRLETVSYKPSFQLEFEYIKAWIDWIKTDWNPLILIVKDNSQIIGILPLMYRDEKRKHLLPYRQVRFLASTKTDFSTILAHPDNIKLVVDKAMQWIISANFHWELLVLDDICEGDPFVKELKPWLDANRVCFSLQEGKYYYINLKRPWDEVWADVSKKYIRRSINLARNRMQKIGQWEVLKNPDWSTQDIISSAKSIHIQRQSELGRQSHFSDLESRSFIQKILDISSSSGRLRSYWLKFGDILIAYLIGFEIQEVFYAWNIGFLPEYNHFFPSKFLFAEVIKDCNERKLKEFNFMRGEADYKTKWTSTFRKNYRFLIKNNKQFYGKFMILLDKLRSK